MSAMNVEAGIKIDDDDYMRLSTYLKDKLCIDIRHTFTKDDYVIPTGQGVFVPYKAFLEFLIECMTDFTRAKDFAYNRITFKPIGTELVKLEYNGKTIELTHSAFVKIVVVQMVLIKQYSKLIKRDELPQLTSLVKTVAKTIPKGGIFGGERRHKADDEPKIVGVVKKPKHDCGESDATAGLRSRRSLDSRKSEGGLPAQG